MPTNFLTIQKTTIMMIQMTNSTMAFIVLLTVSAVLVYKYMSIVYDEHKEDKQQKHLNKALQAYFEYLDRARERRKHELAQQTQHLNTLTGEQMQLNEPNK